MTMEKDVLVAGKKMQGVEIELPGAPLVVVTGKAGFVMCGYLNIEVADKLGVAAAMVRGVKTIDDLLKAPVQAVSKAAEAKGVKLFMKGEEALALLG
jgi:uncharacterized protein YunC (DUF1805 family)